VTPAGTVDLGEPNSTPSLPVFTPDGTRAFVTRNGDHKVSILRVAGDTVEYTKQDVSANLRPYGLQITPKGDLAIVANIGNGPTGGADTLTIIDLAANPPRAIDSLSVGLIPEGIALSPDGTLHGRERNRVFRFDGARLTAAGTIKVSGGPAGIRTAER
jgi:DNA-binding beta-propeller fold protein YncE